MPWGRVLYSTPIFLLAPLNLPVPLDLDRPFYIKICSRSKSDLDQPCIPYAIVCDFYRIRGYFTIPPLNMLMMPLDIRHKTIIHSIKVIIVQQTEHNILVYPCPKRKRISKNINIIAKSCHELIKCGVWNAKYVRNEVDDLHK